MQLKEFFSYESERKLAIFYLLVRILLVTLF